jgi:hypothetical protein
MRRRELLIGAGSWATGATSNFPGKAEAGPAVAPCGLGVGLGEFLEQLRLLLRRHADAGVGATPSPRSPQRRGARGWRPTHDEAAN